MSTVATLLLVVLLLGAGWLLTTGGIPFVVARVGRLLGFRMRPTPLTEQRIRRFRRIRRGYWSFVAVSTAFVLSFFLELYVNDRPLYLRYDDEVAFPAVMEWLDGWVPFVDLAEESRAVAEDFGLERLGKAEVPYREYARWVEDPGLLVREADGIEAAIAADEALFRAEMERAARAAGEAFDPGAPLPEEKRAEQEARREEAAWYRSLAPRFAAGRASIVPTLHPFSPREQLLDLPGVPPHPAFCGEEGVPVFGTDPEGKDVLSQLLYGFRISFAFALLVTFVGFAVGIAVGAVMGYFGGWVDILVQRFVEIWQSIPFFFALIIIASVMTPSFWLLVALLVVLRAWLGITYTIRGEYYREKARDYVQAARALGVSTTKIMARHIFPNALVPVVTFLPFSLVAYIDMLVALDFLGFGLPPGDPSWGKLLSYGADLTNIKSHPHLLYFPIGALAATLFCVVMVGEAVREAFDPKLYSRLR